MPRGREPFCFFMQNLPLKRLLRRGFVGFGQKRDADTWERGEDLGACGGRDARRVLASPPAGGTRGARSGVAAGAGCPLRIGRSRGAKGHWETKPALFFFVCLRAGVAYRNNQVPPRKHSASSSLLVLELRVRHLAWQGVSGDKACPSQEPLALPGHGAGSDATKPLKSARSPALQQF